MFPFDCHVPSELFFCSTDDEMNRRQGGEQKTEDRQTWNEEEDERHRDVQWKESAFKPKRDGTFNLHDSSPHLDRNRHVVQNMRQDSRFRRLDSTFKCQCQAMRQDVFCKIFDIFRDDEVALIQERVALRGAK